MARFHDVPEDHWAYSDVEWAFAMKMMGGFPDGSFCPEEPLTRAQAAALFRRLADNLLAVIALAMTGLRDRAMSAVPKITDWTGDFTSAGSGSGVIVTPDGYVVTNHHVVEGYVSRGRTGKLTASWGDIRGVSLQLIGYEIECELIAEAPEVDLALLKLTSKPSSLVNGFPWLRVASAEEIPGEPVVVMGAPVGELSWSAPGYVAREEVYKQYYRAPQSLIAVAGAINPGNSGGALVRASDGTLLGIPSMKYVDETLEGMGFAVHFRDVAALLRKAGIAQPA